MEPSPASRRGFRWVRWILAAASISIGLVVAFFLALAGALENIDTSGQVEPMWMVAALASAIIGLAVAIWIVRH